MNYLKNPEAIRVLIDDYQKTNKNDNFQQNRARQDVQTEINLSVIKPFSFSIYEKSLQEKVTLKNIILMFNKNNSEHKFTKHLIV